VSIDIVPQLSQQRGGCQGGPISAFESGAIRIYLGEKTGKFWPKSDLAAQVPVLEWLMSQVGGLWLSHFLTQ
jgi:glutathione S-transferase